MNDPYERLNQAKEYLHPELISEFYKTAISHFPKVSVFWDSDEKEAEIVSDEWMITYTDLRT